MNYFRMFAGVSVLSVCMTGCKTAPIAGFSGRSEPTLLITNGWKASWGPGGKEMAYGTGPGEGIRILDLKTGQSRVLTDEGKDAAWSPDGRYIAFVREDGFNNYLSEKVCLIKPTGGSVREVVVAGFPVWSADSKDLFVHCRHHNHIVGVSMEDLTRTNEQFYANTPSWYFAVSPDRTKVAFGSPEKLQICERASGKTLRTWAVPGQRGLLPAWSPDGKLVAFGGFDGSRLGLWVFDWEKNRAARLMAGDFTMPAWSPDGRWLAFDERAADRNVWLVGRRFVDEKLGSPETEH